MLTAEQVRRIRKATGCNVTQFCQCFPFTVKAMRAMEHGDGNGRRLRPPTDREERYLREIAAKWHVDL